MGYINQGMTIKFVATKLVGFVDYADPQIPLIAAAFADNVVPQVPFSASTTVLVPLSTVK